MNLKNQQEYNVVLSSVRRSDHEKEEEEVEREKYLFQGS